MALRLLVADHDYYHDSAGKRGQKQQMNNLQNPKPNEFIYQISSWQGKGYERAIEVHPNLWLSISDIEQHHDYFGKITEYDHPVQFQVLLSGKNLDEYGGQVGEGYTLISGSGV